MSADNMHVVSKLHGKIDQYGIFHTFSSVDPPGKWYSFENAIQVYNYAVPAILAAHLIERDNSTEYGVYVNSTVMQDVPLGHNGRPLGWGYVK